MKWLRPSPTEQRLFLLLKRLMVWMSAFLACTCKNTDGIVHLQTQGLALLPSKRRKDSGYSVSSQAVSHSSSCGGNEMKCFLFIYHFIACLGLEGHEAGYKSEA